MYKIVILILLLFYNISLAGSEDYQIGLNAFEDGFYDVAIMSLEDFIKSSNDAEKISYAKYVLYKSYLYENQFKKSLELINELENIADKRFDVELMKKDKVFILTKVNCEKAVNISQENAELIKIVLNSNCKLNTDFILNALNKKLSNIDYLNLFYKSTNEPEIAEKIFKKINLKKLKDEDKSYIAKYFYKHEKYDNFWEVYKIYKNDDMVNLALSRLYEIENYKSFIRSFNYNKKYNLSQINYCRLIKSYEKIGEKYDCNLINKCINDKDKLITLKTGCLINNANLTDFSNYVNSLSENNINLICDNLYYAINNDFYNNVILSKTKLCENYREEAKQLFKMGKYQDVIFLLSPGKTDEDYILIAASYEKLGKSNKAKVYLDKVKDKSKFNN